jgi:hypothetical protein
VDPEISALGCQFDLGNYMRKFPHLINFEVVDKSEKLLGKCSLKTEEALSLQDFG